MTSSLYAHKDNHYSREWGWGLGTASPTSFWANLEAQPDYIY